MAGKVATSSSNSTSAKTAPQAMPEALESLSGSIGARIKITLSTTSTLEGTLFTHCPILNVVAINTSPSPPNPSSSSLGQPGDYHIIPVSQIQNLTVLSLPESGSATTFANALPPVSKVDTAKLKQREDERIRKIKEEQSKKGKGVTYEAQMLFNALDRVYTNSTRWHGTDIIVSDAVIISPPYTSDSCKAPKEKQQVLAHIRKVVEGERRKMADKARQASPVPPRKGG